MGISDEIEACTVCDAELAQGARPIVRLHKNAKILIASQAPGAVAHASGIPFDDPSGRRLREWLGVDQYQFYKPENFAILPMGFCYPGKATSGDLPPRTECAPLWRQRALDSMPDIRLTLLIGRFAQQWHLQESRSATLTETVRRWRNHWPTLLPLPHPSPRNNPWLKQNPWFEAELLPVLRHRVTEILKTT